MAMIITVMAMIMITTRSVVVTVRLRRGAIVDTTIIATITTVTITGAVVDADADGNKDAAPAALPAARGLWLSW